MIGFRRRFLKSMHFGGGGARKMGFPKEMFPRSLAWTFEGNFGNVPTLHSRLPPHQEGSLMSQARWRGPVTPTTVMGTKAAKWHSSSRDLQPSRLMAALSEELLKAILYPESFWILKIAPDCLSGWFIYESGFEIIVITLSQDTRF